MSKKLVSLVIVCMLLVAVFAGCGTKETNVSDNQPSSPAATQGPSQENPAEDKSDSIVIGYAPTTMNNPFWLAVLDGVKSVLEPQGVKIITIDPQNDQARMNDQIGDLIVAGIDALLVAPVDSTGVKTALEACKNAGIPVINFDTPVADKDLVKSIVASDNYKAGVLVAQDMMSKLQKGAKIAVLHSPSGQACIDRVNGFYDTIGDYFEVVVELDGKGDTAVSLQLAEDILQSTPDIAAIFAVNDPSAIGVVQALAAHPEIEGVLVYGVDGNPDAKKLIKEGKITATAAQSPESIGAETAKAALKVINGETVDKNIVIDTFIIDKSNVDQYGTDGWQ